MSVITALPLTRLLEGWKQLTQKCCNQTCTALHFHPAVSSKRSGIRIADSWYCGFTCFEDAAESILREMIVSSRAKTQARLPRMPLELMLLSRGCISDSQLKFAYSMEQAEGRSVAEILLELGYVHEQQITASIAAQWGYPVFPLRSNHPQCDILVPFHLLEKYRFLPIHFSPASNKLLLGFVNRVDHPVIHAIQQVRGCVVAPCFIATSEYHELLPSFSTARENEVVFENRGSLREMTAITLSYARQLGAREVRFAAGRDFIWIHFQRPVGEFNLLFELS